MQTSDRDITTYWNIASGSKHSQVQQLKCTEKEPVGVAVAENAKVILCHLFETELEWNGRCLVGPSLFCKTLFTFGKFLAEEWYLLSIQIQDAFLSFDGKCKHL